MRTLRVTVDPTQGDSAPAHGSARASRGGGATAASFAVLVLTRLMPGRVPWAVWRLARGPQGLGPVPGLRFARVLGSGRNAGFGLVPGLDVQGVFAAFESLDAAEAWAERGPGLQAYADHALHHLRMTLRVTSARGSWGGATMAPPVAPTSPTVSTVSTLSTPASARADAAPGNAVVAALTRASIRPLQLAAFWRHSPRAERDLARAAGCRLAVGLGEAPLLRQATFSLWDDVASMDAYARSGAHGQAIRSAWKSGYFSESMFVRFAPLRMRGHWPGAAHG